MDGTSAFREAVETLAEKAVAAVVARTGRAPTKAEQDLIVAALTRYLTAPDAPTFTVQ